MLGGYRGMHMVLMMWQMVLSESAPYIWCLLGDRPGILVLSAHWLWLYELDKLGNICEGYAETGKANSRLMCESDGGRGCDGIGLLWHKSIGGYSSFWDLLGPYLCCEVLSV